MMYEASAYYDINQNLIVENIPFVLSAGSQAPDEEAASVISKVFKRSDRQQHPSFPLENQQEPVRTSLVDLIRMIFQIFIVFTSITPKHAASE